MYFHLVKIQLTRESTLNDFEFIHSYIIKCSTHKTPTVNPLLKCTGRKTDNEVSQCVYLNVMQTDWAADFYCVPEMIFEEIICRKLSKFNLFRSVWLFTKQEKSAHKVEEQQDLEWERQVMPSSHPIMRQETYKTNNLQLNFLSV